MLKSFLTFCLMLLLVSPALAVEKDIYPYVGLTLGSTLTSVDRMSDSSGSLNTQFNPGYMAGLSAGLEFNSQIGWNIDKVRAEAEVGYRSSELTSMNNTLGQSASMGGRVSVTNYMLNCYIENTNILSSDMPVNIFLTAGVGAASASISSISYQNAQLVKPSNSTQFAFQGGFGFSYELREKIYLDAAYKYMGTTPFKFSGVKADYVSHNILLGARYAFK
jgi:opacity protein-like surface antigen